ncbi:methionyl-tRNA formyltransferase [Lactococcus plantarum]|uniref:Methionyl-tRNA formyltransferase n=2 Tax=Pseudolactococcus plantarum TaxID=1365 RepID=A0A2A5S0F8_9LACT|nr:methionyl-tRNA formyltransferase [Lactococcus plantarum]
MGTPAFSVPVLDGLIEAGYEVVAVVTQPDRAVGRKKEIKMTPVKVAAQRYSLPVYQPEKISGSDEMADLMQLGADIIVTAAFGQFLPEKLLNSVTHAVNVHASLLPKYRGGAPVHYAIINGDEQAGVTIMEMVKQMDAGDMISQKAIPITDTDDVGTMFEKLSIVGRDLLLATLPDYLLGKLHPTPQDEKLVTFSPNITSEEEKIDWSASARDVFNQVRGMSPWPVAHTTWQGARFKLHAVRVAEGSGKPGQVIDKTKKSLVIATHDGAVSLVSVQPAGKPKMPIQDFLNGLGKMINIGDQFE